jgi:hypothetical protein
MDVSRNDRMDRGASRRVGEARRSSVDRGVDGSIDTAKLLIRQAFPDRHPLYDIVLM